MLNIQKKILSLSLPDQITASLRASIISGDIHPGEPLRQEEIAAQFDTSRIPVREALRRLQSEGLVTFHPHKGVIASVLSATDLRELFEIRVMIEPPALRAAIPSMDDETFHIASDLIEQMDADDITNPIGSLNRDFHMHLYAPANRPHLHEMISSLYAKTDRYGQSAERLAWYHTVTQQEHKALLDACRHRNIDDAAALLTVHIESFGQLLVTRLEQEEMKS